MGLDITARGKVGTFIGAVEPDMDWRLYEHVYVEPSFPKQADGIASGFYTDCGEEFGFRAGSYSGYNEWRRLLCRLALDVDPDAVWKNPDAFTGRPFVELINFSDCEGTIGPTTSAKLAHDFDNYIDKIDSRGWFRDRYDDWRKAFRLAAHGGFVRFH